MADNNKRDVWEKETGKENVIICPILLLSRMRHQDGGQAVWSSTWELSDIQFIHESACGRLG